MARHGSVGAFSGFSVCQPALGASLQWLPAIGTAELDDMINTFLPGPASIQDKRAHISMDFFEYYRQTGENFKFYPATSGSFTPVTASPATSALYDSGYASSCNHSPVLSDQGSWAQSPVSSAPAATDARTKSRSTTSKKSGATPVDFASHPGMRILTKDGRDVTNSASRGCKTKEQRDHAHLMRIIKACDACKKKKIRCDPSHRKRNASQASTAAQAEQKPAKRAKKAEESPPVAVADAATDFAAGDAFAPEMLSFPSFDTSYPQDSEEFWNEFVTLDQEPVAFAPAPASVPAIDDFLFDSFTNPQNFFSPSSGSTATSPSQALTPFTPAGSTTSPITASDVAVDVPGEFSFEDLAVPYLNPGVAHGTNYVDFNLYSPGPEVFDEDPVLQMRDLGSQQHSPQSPGSHNSPQISPTDVGARVALATSTHEQSGGELHSPWYYDPGDAGHVELQPGIPASSTDMRLTTNHNRLVASETGVGYSSNDGQSSNHLRLLDGDGSHVLGTSSVSAPAARHSTVVASALQSSVSPSRAPRPRRVNSAVAPSAPPGGSLSSPVGSPVSTKAIQSAMHDSPGKFSLPTATACCQQCATHTVSSAAGDQSRKAAAGGAVRASMLGYDQNCASSSVSRQRLAGRGYAWSGRLDGQHVVQQETAAANAVLATILLSTLPTRRNVAGEDVKHNTFFFQLAVFGLVSLLCACALQAPLASQVNLVNILAITSISLARFAPPRWCSGPSSATRVASKTLSPPTPPPSLVDYVESKVQSITGRLRDLRCTVSRRVGSIMPRPPSVRTLRL
ncbi:hypothetical protein C8A00DRAFT_36414 [Chaetomidium leptoderma]|uniref:Uncharacterized protein n=1 Tax=Chaetomidium leptoderma TaxID=669021 RepID=A0AAN6ZT57_9PEZI|nr:hypothetical protein C8A00DRAFT_36414 [Chaetomidium leptoderma]